MTGRPRLIPCVRCGRMTPFWQELCRSCRRAGRAWATVDQIDETLKRNQERLRKDAEDEQYQSPTV